jgi:hypothetical protein
MRWKDQGVAVTVQIGLGSDRQPQPFALWGTARWGAARWSSSEPCGATSPAKRCPPTITRGVEHAFDRFGVSTASLALLNVDGWVWAAQPLVLRPGRPIRLVATHPTLGSFALWRGFVDNVAPVGEGGAVAAVTLDCVDALSVFAQVNQAELDPPVGAGELTGARMHRIADLAVWPAQWRRFDPGVVRVQSTNLARNLLDEAGVTADSEGGGALYADRDGMIVYRGRNWQRTVGVDRGTLPGSAGCPTGYRLSHALADVANRVLVARAGGTQRTFNHGASQSKYGVRTCQRNDLICQDDVDVDWYGSAMLALKPTPATGSPVSTWTPAPVTPGR